MSDFSAARQHMLDSQIRTNDVTDLDILASFRQTPRETFVPNAQLPLAYSDVHIDLGDDRWLTRPRDFSKMVQSAEIAPTDIVLDIACARGYSTAVLAGLCETVIGLEDTDEAVNRATENLVNADVTNAAIVKGDLKSGAREHGPFNVIVVNGSVTEVPKTWTDQLANGGRLVVIVQDGPIGRCMVITRSGDALGEKVMFDASVPQLAGFAKTPVFTF
ncbi:MAG: protein-L-isoaspartate O-methyltransferase family protein [Maricaulaceae bacterium]